MGRGQVRGIREEDGMLEVWAMGWEMAGEQRPRYFVSRDAVKVVPTVYYKMPGECCNLGALVRLCVSAFSGLGGGGGRRKRGSIFWDIVLLQVRVDFKANKLSFMIRTAAAASAPTSFRPAFLTLLI